MAQAQENINPEELFESLSEELPEDTDLSEISEKWYYYLKHPIDLNKTDGTALNELQFLNPLLLQRILEHRQVSGNFIHVLELQSIEGFDARLVNLLLPFVRVGETSPLKDAKLRDFSHELMIRYGKLLEKAKGYQITDTSRSRYLGDANKYAVRYRAALKDKIRLAINMEKDAGEPFFSGRQKLGFDFYSVSLAVKKAGRINNLIIGDYALQFGQGISMWNGLSFGKGGLVQNTARQGIGAKQYTSLNETNFMRGLTATIQLQPLEITPYFSYRSIDGNVTDQDGERILKTIAVSGLHRTPTELRYRNAAHQMTYGINILWRYNRMKIGVNVNQSQLDAIKVKGSGLRQQYDFEGDLLRNVSLYTNYTFRNLHLFGEFASSLDGGTAWLFGTIMSLHQRLSSVLLIRDYKRNFHTFYGQGFGESSNTANEQGAYLGLTYQLARKLLWSNYVDIFRFPEARYQADTSSLGADIFSQLTYMWYKKGQLSLRYRNRLKQVNYSGEGNTETGLVNTAKQQVRLEFQYKLDRVWTIRTRAEANLYQKEHEENTFGYLFYQDIFWKPSAGKIQLNSRVAYFQTDSYDNRMYAYENDVLYGSSFGMYTATGWRTYMNVRYRVGNRLDIWAKYGVYFYPGMETIGSGLDEINGGRKSEIKIQLRWQL
ncbi:helix-hairpin-helix domain-containing protein [Sphingobacterium sp. InxBP1]|uniref:helix-hairpin-helix domain-containing protein n=1 Tax=Sphingobacterium sp. InxBP1 TaxID=2870328 RepID=UPI002243608B|nr:helix-hairpin-helix domain-containing protein [Sphingobacterium sp. InxBP1]MCW8312951.1 helix-hairpin-helix domain-containing protein [Sphingobacterium sp. InxBP1]